MPTPINPGPLTQAIDVIEASNWRDINLIAGLLVIVGALAGVVASAL